MVDRNSFILGYLLGRKGAGERRKPFASTRPKMPTAKWRVLAAICFLVPGCIALLITSESDGAWGYAIGAGIIGLVVGMYTIETIWERRQPSSPDPSIRKGPA